MSLVDSHCHLDASQFSEDREDVIQRAMDAGVSRLLSIGTGDGPPVLDAAIRLAERYDAVFATAGIHPEHAPAAKDSDYKQLGELLAHPKCVAVGEIGLDYHWKPYDPALQATAFVEQMRIAASAQKPISVHTRDAWSDTMALLKQHWAPTGLPCVMHCFTGTFEQAAEAIGLGFYLSFSGVLTYPKAVELHLAAKQAPLDRILVETDCPYLPPVPYRGKRNEPAWVEYTARKLAELRGIDYETVASSTTAVFEQIFIDRLH